MMMAVPLVLQAMAALGGIGWAGQECDGPCAAAVFNLAWKIIQR